MAVIELVSSSRVKESSDYGSVVGTGAVSNENHRIDNVTISNSTVKADSSSGGSAIGSGKIHMS
jgi:hypothetical protein